MSLTQLDFGMFACICDNFRTNFTFVPEYLAREFGGETYTEVMSHVAVLGRSPSPDLVVVEVRGRRTPAQPEKESEKGAGMTRPQTPTGRQVQSKRVM